MMKPVWTSLLKFEWRVTEQEASSEYWVTVTILDRKDGRTWLAVRRNVRGERTRANIDAEADEARADLVRVLRDIADKVEAGQVLS